MMQLVLQLMQRNGQPINVQLPHKLIFNINIK